MEPEVHYRVQKSFVTKARRVFGLHMKKASKNGGGGGGGKQRLILNYRHFTKGSA
jgi:hypothetical protein